MVAAVGARHIAQQVGLGAHAMQVDRDRVVGAGVALQHQPDRPAEPDRGLRRRDRALAAERDRQHGPGKQHEVAGRDQDQRIFGERRNPGQCRLDGAGRRRGAAALLVRSSWSSRGMRKILGMARGRAALARQILCSCSFRQPFARCRPEISNRAGGNSIRRWKWPCGISSRWILASPTSRGSGRSPLTISTPALRRHLDLVGLDPGQGDQDGQRLVALEDVARRLPGRRRVAAMKKLPMQALGALHRLAGLCPHQRFELSFRHLRLPLRLI